MGRTGTFITVDAMMQRLEEKDDLEIYNFVTQMRTKRTFMVQNLVCMQDYTLYNIIAGVQTYIRNLFQSEDMYTASFNNHYLIIMNTKANYSYSYLFTFPQEQYAFIHDALNDYLRCGNTAVAAHKLRAVTIDMQKEEPQTGCSGFEQQFKVM